MILVNELLSYSFTEEEQAISDTQLNPLNNGYILHFEDEISTDGKSDAKPFSHINDSAEFTKQIRNQPGINNDTSRYIFYY